MATGMGVLSAILVLVGMVFLVSTITEKALAIINAEAKGTCGIAKEFGIITEISHPCEFTYVSKELKQGQWCSYPTSSGTHVQWKTAGTSCSGAPFPHNEEGSVTYKVGGGEAKLYFDSPAVGSNKCNIDIVSGLGTLTGGCYAGPGHSALFTYTMHSPNK